MKIEHEKLIKILNNLGLTKQKKLTYDSIAIILEYLEKERFVDALTLSTLCGIDYKSIYIYLKELNTLGIITINQSFVGNRRKQVYSLKDRNLNSLFKRLISEKIKALKELEALLR